MRPALSTNYPLRPPHTRVLSPTRRCWRATPRPCTPWPAVLGGAWPADRHSSQRSAVDSTTHPQGRGVHCVWVCGHALRIGGASEVACDRLQTNGPSSGGERTQLARDATHAHGSGCAQGVSLAGTQSGCALASFKPRLLVAAAALGGAMRAVVQQPVPAERQQPPSAPVAAR